MITPAILNEIVAIQCMKLTSTLLSKYDFIDLVHPTHEYWCLFEDFISRFDDLFAKELIELSSLARVSLDIDSSFGSKEIVGVLIEEGNRSDLNFRQACNKVIHASKFEVDLAWSKSHPLDNGRNGYGESSCSRFKNPIIKIEGKYNEKEWQADICFLKFIEILKEKF